MCQSDSDEHKQTPQITVYEIPAEGSLGLLALGAKGIDLWREKRNRVRLENEALLKKSDVSDEEK